MNEGSQENIQSTVGRAIERVARESYGRLVAYLSVHTHDLASAEDALRMVASTDGRGGTSPGRSFQARTPPADSSLKPQFNPYMLSVRALAGLTGRRLRCSTKN